MERFVWRFSAKNSCIEFKIKYYKISNISGFFSVFEGEIIANEDFSEVDIKLLIETSSVNANNKRRNKNLKSINCLHTIQYPKIVFSAVNGCHLSEGNIPELCGTLIIKGISREISLVINYSRIGWVDHSPVAIFTLFGCISRKDFDLSREDDNLDDIVHLTARIELSKWKKTT